MILPVEISSDTSRLELGVIHEFLAGSYWSPGIRREVVERAISGSICFGAYLEGKQIGFARAISDRATFGYLADVFVLEPYRGRGVARQLVAAVLAHSDLQGLRRMLLATKDAHGLYAQLGFLPLSRPERFMEIHRPL